MRIAYEMSKAAALARGEDRYGTMVVEIPAAQLSDAERLELAHWTDVRKGIAADYDLHCCNDGGSWRYAPLAGEPGADGVRALLARCAELRADALAKGAQQEAETRARCEAAIDAELAVDRREAVRVAFDGSHIRQLGRWDSLDANSVEVIVDAPRVPGLRSCDTDGASPEARERYSTARAAAKEALERLLEAQRCELERLFLEKEQRTAREKAEAAAAKAREKAEAETGMAEWLDVHATENQRQRHDAGLLPEDEVLQSMADVAFLALSGEPRYEKLRASDVGHEENCYAPDPKFEASDAESVTAEQWDRLQALRALAPDGAEVRARLHECWCSACDGGGIERRFGALVIVKRFGRRLRREYALEGGQPE
jgi:hypothetical protein